MKRGKFISKISSLGAIAVVAPMDLLYATASSSANTKPGKNSIRLIRNATLRIQYAGKIILVDPLLAAKGAYSPFAGGARNPTVDLPAPAGEIIKDIDLVLVSHTHSDHFDKAARELLPRTVKLINQPADEDYFKKTEFSNTETLHDHIVWNGIDIYRTGGKHGSGELGKKMGTVSGFVLKAKGQPCIYIIGDSTWTDEVEQSIEKYQPDFIVANTGGARFPGFEDSPILMDEEQCISLLKASGKAKVIAVHMEALDHCATTRSSLQEKVHLVHGKKNKLRIPRDGEQIML